MEFKKFGGYRIGSNIPFRKGSVWENVARVSRWGAKVVELNADAHNLGTQALSAIKQQAAANDLVYTWHIPPAAQQSGELALVDKKQNEFGRKVMEQAMVSAMEVGARHITFHATTQAARLPEDQLYIYDAQKEQVGPAKLVEGLTKPEMVKMLDESAKAQLRTQVNRLESQQALVNQLEKNARRARDMGVDDQTAYDIAYLAAEAAGQGRMVGVQPEDMTVWRNIQEKAFRMKPLTDREKEVVKHYSNKVINQVADYKVQINNSMKQLKPTYEKVKQGKSLVLDGEEKMRQNVADNIAKLNPEIINRAVKNGLTLGLENLPGHQLFSTPEELIDLRNRTVKALVDSGKLSEEKAKQFVGFTFDFGHANTTRYFDIKGKKFKSPSEFIDQLPKDSIRHVHATDSLGVMDSHLPLGQGEITRDEFNKIQEALKRSGFHGVAIHELGASEIPALYGSSMEWVEGGNYMVNDLPTSSMWGPSYMAAAMNDPLMLERDKGYFYESFADIY